MLLYLNVILVVFVTGLNVWYWFIYEPKRKFVEHFGKNADQNKVIRVLDEYATKIDKAVNEVVVAANEKCSKILRDAYWEFVDPLGHNLYEVRKWQDAFNDAAKRARKRGFDVPDDYTVLVNYYEP